jgi:hypothetical protein
VSAAMLEMQKEGQCIWVRVLRLGGVGLASVDTGQGRGFLSRGTVGRCWATACPLRRSVCFVWGKSRLVAARRVQVNTPPILQLATTPNPGKKQTSKQSMHTPCSPPMPAQPSPILALN